MKQEKTDLRGALIHEAIILLDSGSSEISLRSVARAAGVSAMAPYRHFEDKAALLGAVSAEGFEELKRDLETADDRADGAEALVEQGLAYIAFALRRPSLFRLMFAGDDLVCRPVMSGRSAFDVLAQRVSNVSPTGAPAGALACWASVHGLATLALDKRLSANPDETRAVLTLVADAILKS